MKELDLDGLVVCGGDDSNTNAAVLAETFAAKGEVLCCVHTMLSQLQVSGHTVVLLLCIQQILPSP